DDLEAYLIAITTVGAGVGAGGVVLNPSLILIGAQTLTEAATMIEAQKNDLKRRIAILEDKFLENISFDAGVGEFTNSSDISIAQQNTRNINLELDVSLETTIGFKLNDSGILTHTTNNIKTAVNSSLTNESDTATTVTYTLKDNDPDNFLSINVVNAFDGNGPVFSTIGGRTSCPYEGADSTIFYNHKEYEDFIHKRT